MIGAKHGTTGKGCAYRLTRRLRVPDPKPVQVGRRPVPPPPGPPSRAILPPGAPVNWHAITIGTSLEGRPFT